MGTPAAPGNSEGSGNEPPPQGPGVVGREPIHDGRLLKISMDEVRFPDGTTGRLEMIQHPGASAILPFLDDPWSSDPRVVLIRQYRYATGGYIYEVPAGIPDVPGEPWEDCARRELEEETGYRAGQLRALTRIYTTPGFTDEVIHLFAAWDLEPGSESRDADEFIEVVELRISEALDLARKGELIDAKSLATLLFAQEFLRDG